MTKLFLFLTSSLILLGKNDPITVGETLSYRASFRGINAAEASLKVIEKTVIENDSAYHVRFLAKSKGPIHHLFPINDEINIWLDSKTFLPIKIHENIREGNYKKSREIYFNQKENYAVVNDDTLNIDKNTQSPFSLFYFFRKNSIEDFRGETITLIQNGKNIFLKLIVKENQKVIVPAGSFMCTEVSPVRKDNKKFKNKAELAIMFSNDKDQYPVKIRIKLKFGYLVLELDQILS